MGILLRVIALSLFAALGVALAIPVAEWNERLTEEATGAAAGTDEWLTDQEASPTRLPAADRSHGERPSLPPANSVSFPSGAGERTHTQGVWEALASVYAPPVANPFASFRDALEKIQATQDKAEQTLSRLEEDLPRLNSPAPSSPVATGVDDSAAPVPPAAIGMEDDSAARVPPAARGNAEGATAPIPPTPESLPPPRPAGEPRISQTGEDVLSIHLHNSDLREVLKLLSEASGLNILATPSVQATVSASLVDVDVHTALNAILKSTGYASRREGNFFFVGTKQDLQGMSNLDDFISTRVYRPNYVTASELQQLITPLLSTGVGAISVSASAEVGIASDAVSAGGDSYAGEEVVLVRDYETVLAEIDYVVGEVDRMPLQVAIEATLLSVKLDDRNTLGVDFELLRQKDTIRIVSGTPLNSLLTASFAEGLKIGFLDTSLFLFLEALETIGDTSVIASPRVMCLNKQRAEILIGAELGYVSTTVTETAATQTVEFLEVGTHLRIRPFVSSDGMVRMEVHPELSQGTVRVEDGLTLPDKEVTQVTTNIMCRSGATVVIGGLIREDLVTTATQIPVLGNLPILGPLFRQRTEETDRREIIVLLTPRIVSQPEAAQEGTRYAQQFHDRRDVFLDKMSPLGKRDIGEHYLRLGRAAWAAGDADVALQNANLAIHFDPLNQGAVNLRNDVLALAPQLETGVHAHLRRGLPPWQRPHPDYSKLGYPWQETDHLPEDAPHAPQATVSDSVGP
jgi:type II secretory pathway component GspD/PulD (secretin)